MAAHYAVPTMYHFREFAAAGGLVSYGATMTNVYRDIGIYTGRILKGGMILSTIGQAISCFGTKESPPTRPGRSAY